MLDAGQQVLQQAVTRVKTALINDFFLTWASLVIHRLELNTRQNRLAFIDLFCGRGHYNEDVPGAPLFLLSQAVNHYKLSRMLVAMFNDSDEKAVESLQKEAARVISPDRMAQEPIFSSLVVNNEIASHFEGVELIPSLVFLDPWHNNGVTARVINSFLKNKDCDCFLFFSIRREDLGLDRRDMWEKIADLFEGSYIEKVTAGMRRSHIMEREFVILDTMAAMLTDLNHRLVLPFTCRLGEDSPYKHYLLYVTNSAESYYKIKEIIYEHKSITKTYVPRFSFCDVGAGHPFLHRFTKGIEELKKTILKEYAGRTVGVMEMFVRFNLGEPYCMQSFKDAMLQLLKAGLADVVEKDDYRYEDIPTDHIRFAIAKDTKVH